MDGTITGPPPLTSVAGPLLIAYLINWGLLGMLCVQTYYIAFPKDRKSTKLLVYGLSAMELVQTLIATHDAFTIYARNFSNPAILTGVHNSWITVPLLGGVAGFVTQIFFSYRILVISQSRILSAVIAFISLVSFVSALIGVVFIQREHDLRELQKKNLVIITAIWNGSGAICDALIAIFMTYYLSRRATGFPATNVMLTKLIRVTIETGILTASVAIISLILFVAFPTTGFFIVLAVIMAKVYANTILVILNNGLEIINGRSEIQRERETNTYSLAEGKLSFGRVFGKMPYPLGGPPVVDMINIRKEVWRDGVDSEATDLDTRNLTEGQMESLSMQKKVLEIA